ncbi:MAG: hypothetical protein ACOCWG_00240 [bacterium]
MNKKIKVNADDILDRLFFNIYTTETDDGEAVGCVTFDRQDVYFIQSVFEQFGVEYELGLNEEKEYDEDDDFMFYILMDNNLKSYAPKMYKRFVNNLGEQELKRFKLNELKKYEKKNIS